MGKAAGTAAAEGDCDGRHAADGRQAIRGRYHAIHNTCLLH
jgi:hypothetical protein